MFKRGDYQAEIEDARAPSLTPQSGALQPFRHPRPQRAPDPPVLWRLGLGDSPSHSPDCRMMPLSVLLTSSLLSMAGFWEEGAQSRGR